MKIKNNTKQGYIEAELYDGIDISSRMESHRGTVQKGLAQTLTCEGGNNVGVVVNKKIDLCDKLIKQGKVVEGNIVKHSRTKNAAKNIDSSIIKDDSIPSLTTRPDVLGVVVNAEKEQNLCIRKLTPAECLKLMGFTNEDYESLVKAGLSDSNIYHVAGDGLITTLFGSLINNMYRELNSHEDIINNYVEKEIL